MKNSVKLSWSLAIFCIMYMGVFLFKIPRLLIDSQSINFVITFCCYACLFGLGILLLKADLKRNLVWISRNKVKSLLILAGGYVLYTISVLIGGLLYNWISSMLHIGDAALQNDLNIMQAVTIMPPVITLFVLSLAGPAVEEMFYRYVLISGLTKYVPAWLAIMASSLLFAMLHMSSLQVSEFIHVLPHFFMGAALGVIYYKTNNIIFPVLLHAFNNFSALLPQLL